MSNSKLLVVAAVTAALTAVLTLFGLNLWGPAQTGSEAEVTSDASTEINDVVVEAEVIADEPEIVAQQAVPARFALTSSGDGTARPNSVAVLADGSAVIVGEFEGVVQFGDSAVASVLDTDGFVAKTTPGGRWDWAERIGGLEQTVITDVAVASDGSILVVGWSRGPVNFSTIGEIDAGGFVAKISASGQWVWVTQVDAFLSAIGTLDDGSAIVAGGITSVAVFGDTVLQGVEPEAGFETLVAARIAPDGQWLWATATTGGSGEVDDIAVHPDGSALIVGRGGNGMQFGPQRVDDFGALVVKISPNGQWQWARLLRGAEDIWGVAVLHDGSALVTGWGNEVTVGATRVRADADRNLFAAKLSDDGEWQWVNGAVGGLAMGNGVASRDDGSAVIIATASPGATIGSATVPISGGGGVLIAAIDSGGSWMWGTTPGGDASIFADGIATGPAGPIVAVGSFSDGRIDLGPDYSFATVQSRVFVTTVTDDGILG